MASEGRDTFVVAAQAAEQGKRSGDETHLAHQSAGGMVLPVLPGEPCLSAGKCAAAKDLFVVAAQAAGQGRPATISGGD